MTESTTETATEPDELAEFVSTLFRGSATTPRDDGEPAPATGATTEGNHVPAEGHTPPIEPTQDDRDAQFFRRLLGFPETDVATVKVTDGATDNHQEQTA